MKVRINGQKTDTEQNKLFGLRDSIYIHHYDIISIINGFQSSSDTQLHEDDEITFIKKGTVPSYSQLEHMMMARHTPKVHEKVKNSHVAICGLGGLGSNIAISLARTGVGHLHLVDFDIVEPSNLNRQNYFIKHLGMRKTDALREQIKEINPFLTITTDFVRVTEDNAASLLSAYPIVCEAFDDATAKAMLINTLLSQCPYIKIVSASGLAGYESSNSITTKKINDNLYLCGDGVTAAQPGRGLMSPRAMVCAGHQANMILRLILNENNS